MFNQLKQVQQEYHLGGIFKFQMEIKLNYFGLFKDTVKLQISTETETEDEDMMPDLDRRSAVAHEEETLATREAIHS